MTDVKREKPLDLAAWWKETEGDIPWHHEDWPYMDAIRNLIQNVGQWQEMAKDLLDQHGPSIPMAAFDLLMEIRDYGGRGRRCVRTGQ